MRVLLAPYHAGSNPYLDLLAAALRDAGVETRFAGTGGAFPFLSDAVRAGRPDLIHVHWQHPFLNGRRPWTAASRTARFFAQWTTLRAAGVRSVWTVHNLVHHETRSARWELRACRALARRVDALTVHCAAAIEPVSAAYGVASNRVAVVPHGHFAGILPPGPPRAEARRALGIEAGTRVLLCFGLIRRYKGLERLLHAFRRIPDRHARLVIAGRPIPRGYGAEVEASAAPDERVVVRLRHAADDELAGLLNACDLAVLPYRESLTSGAAILAASRGRPILVPRIGCMAELPADATIAYQPGEPEALERALARALDSALEPMGRAAEAFARSFTWEAVARRTVEVYQAALGGRVAGVSGAGSGAGSVETNEEMERSFR